jgi:hypothetical protein
MKTYLQLINEVLKRLREDQVGTVDYSSYSSLISTFVNDAKREVENSWSWEVLKTSYTITPDGVNTEFTITGLDESDARLAYDDCDRPLVFDVKINDEFQLHEYSYATYLARKLTDPDGLASNDKPNWFAVNKMPDGTWKVFFDGLPATDRSYRLYFYEPQSELETASTELLVPWRPVVHLALLYALDERGEEIGEPGSKAWMRYENSLTDAIAMDSVGNSAKITFKV